MCEIAWYCCSTCTTILLFSIYMQLPDPGDNMDDDSDSDMSDISGLSETVWKTTPGKRK